MADNFFEACLKRAPVVAGPIADFTDSPFRRVLRSFSNCLVYTEMISGHGLSQRNESSLKYAFFKNEERPIVHQIFGSLPERMAEAARVLASNGAEAIDINMGCPQHRLARHGEGAALMNDFEKAAAIVSKVKDVTGLPVSVKIRAGYDYASVIAGKSAQKIAPVLENAGADMIVVHPRLKIQMFSGMPDHSVTLAVRKAVDIPVVANGNLDNVLLAKKVWQEMRDVSESKGLGKGSCGIMVSRGIRGNPLLPAYSERILASESAAGEERVSATGETIPSGNTKDTFHNSEDLLLNHHWYQRLKNYNCEHGFFTGLFERSGPFQEKNSSTAENATEDEKSDERLSFTLHTLIEIIKKHHAFCKEEYGDEEGIRQLRKHLPYYIRGIPNSKNLSVRAVAIKNENEFEEWLQMVRSTVEAALDRT